MCMCDFEGTVKVSCSVMMDAMRTVLRCKNRWIMEERQSRKSVCGGDCGRVGLEAYIPCMDSQPWTQVDRVITGQIG